MRRVCTFRLRKWAQKIAKRHEHDYHPLLNLKSWARLPVATGYGLVAGTGAVGVGVGGCAVGVYLKDNNNEICKASIEASGYLCNKRRTYLRARFDQTSDIGRIFQWAF